jgi:hypothetical protein
MGRKQPAARARALPEAGNPGQPAIFDFSQKICYNKTKNPTFQRFFATFLRF